MNRRIHLPQSGFSLLELLVAITIGLFLLAGAVTMFTSNRRIYNDQQDLSHIQQGARFALDLMVHDIRMAGYMGCADDLARVSNNLRGNVDNGGVAGNLFDLDRPIEGSESGSNWLPSDNSTDFVIANLDGEVVALTDATGPSVDERSDAITLHSIGGPRIDITGNTSGASGTSITIDNTGLGITQNEVLAIADCTGTDIFQNTANVTAVVNTQLTHTLGAAGVDAANAVAGLARAYDGAGTTPASVSRVTAVRYFIGEYLPDDLPDAVEPARRGLFRRFWDANAAGGAVERNELLVDGVDRMEITYGVDTSGDDLPDTYVSADDGNLGATAASWNNVVSVRIGLLLRSLRANAAEQDTAPAVADPVCDDQRNVNGTCVPYGADAVAADGLETNVRRRVITTTVFLRNDLL